MEVILKQDNTKFGKTGTVVKVKDGFARNFLFPRNLAIAATPANIKRVEQERQRVQSHRLHEKEQALSLSKRLSEVSITIPVQTHDEGQLYGGINASEITDALKEEGFSEIDKNAVVLDEPIKSIGVYEVTVKLHSEVNAKIKVWVVKK
ncbi:MAG: 50S ribosomal protein L9 [Candidatus Omnitrophota bacterium]